MKGFRAGCRHAAGRDFQAEQFKLTTKLDTPLKRELSVQGKPYTLTISPTGLNLAPKGRRKGYELAWMDLVSGDAALATALNASLVRGPKTKPSQAAAKKTKPSAPGAKKPGRKLQGSRKS